SEQLAGAITGRGDTLTWWLAHGKDEEYLGDLATSVGLKELRGFKIPELTKFLDAGIADAGLIAGVRNAIKGKKKLAYIDAMLAEAKPPVITTDGVVEGGGEEEEE